MAGSSTPKNNNKGFTLVEVIVVAVIVAVLALVGIQLYQGYATEARRNTAENLAASAASYLQTFVNARGTTFVIAANFPQLVGPSNPAPWSQPLNPDIAAGTPDQSTVVFNCPSTATITVDYANFTVQASIASINSKLYRYQ